MGKLLERIGTQKSRIESWKRKLRSSQECDYLGSYTTYDVSESNAAWTKAYSKLVTGISGLTSNLSHYYYWFGMYPTSTVWSNTFSLVKLQWKKTLSNCISMAVFARVTFTLTPTQVLRTIYLCGANISAPDSGVDTKFGTLVHEMTHDVVATRDIAYRQRYHLLDILHSPTLPCQLRMQTIMNTMWRLCGNV